MTRAVQNKRIANKLALLEEVWETTTMRTEAVLDTISSPSIRFIVVVVVM